MIGLISGGVSSDEEERIRKEMEVEKKKYVCIDINYYINHIVVT